MGFFKWLLKKKTPIQPKIGLALGSGGAKGFAELGVIKALEENGIIADIIGGTSIGSIIGAFYANNYSATDLLCLLESIDFSEIKSKVPVNMDTSRLFTVIDRMIGSLNIEELKKPFVAVATNYDTLEEKVFKTGNVAKALCASASYPPFFKAVAIGKERFVDGAFCNSIPADRVRELGADIVIGVDLSNHDPQPQGMLSKFIPTFKGNTDEPWKSGYEFSDVMIHPDLTDFKAVSFFAGNEMFDIGYDSAMEKMDEIKSIIANFNGKRKE